VFCIQNGYDKNGYGAISLVAQKALELKTLVPSYTILRLIIWHYQPREKQNKKATTS